jgi:hypothetical protein
MEYKIRRLQQALTKAENAERQARLVTEVLPDDCYRVTPKMTERAAWWAAEVERLNAELLALLKGAGDDEMEASEAASVLSRSRGST